MPATTQHRFVLEGESCACDEHRASRENGLTAASATVSAAVLITEWKRKRRRGHRNRRIENSGRTAMNVNLHLSFIAQRRRRRPVSRMKNRVESNISLLLLCGMCHPRDL
jgi:hypothetical protein